LVDPASCSAWRAPGRFVAKAPLFAMPVIGYLVRAARFPSRLSATG